MGFAEPDDLAAVLLMDLGQRTGTPESGLAAIHNDIRICTQHSQPPRLPLCDFIAVVVQAFIGVVPQTGKQDR